MYFGLWTGRFESHLNYTCVFTCNNYRTHSSYVECYSHIISDIEFMRNVCVSLKIFKMFVSQTICVFYYYV